ncbi:MAG TPA: hypothetical protein HA254_00750 [Candidatus Diapherotrites archaeon]|uniref:Uncharacterized protein n=1 Tax=Candidatus Iainarchaeum sp. TaxID=3101447 RepID=A0A7J4IZE5_9ARCH|nr:hypothetical protein [Candidatus Diapherotrites archaeon]
MAKNIISSYSVFQERFQIPEGRENAERLEALKKYFSRGGVINAIKVKGALWPKLIYPTPLRLDFQIKEIGALRENYSKKEKDWKEKNASAKSYHKRHQILKFSEPLYWKHVTKALTDKDYKEDAQKVVLPVHLSADPKWKPMIKMFVNDLEYRKNLVETVQTSIVYKKDRKVAKYADVLQELRTEISGTKMGELGKKIGQIESDLNALKVIRKWAAEG